MLKKNNPTNLFSADFILPRKQMFFFLAVIFFFALALRAVRAFETGRIAKDAVDYVRMAQNISENGLLNAFALNARIPPLYIILMAAADRIGLGAETGGILISIVSGALLTIPVFFIAKRLFASPLPALIAAFLTAVHPNLVRVSAEILRDPLFYLLSTVSLWMMIESAATRRNIFSFFAGIAAAFAVMTRSEGVELMAAFILWSSYETLFPFIGFSSFRQRAGKFIFLVLFFVLGFGLAAMPVECMMKNTLSQWHIVDTRIQSYLKSLIKLSPKDIYEHEKY
jgi:hypothetical protein